MARKIIALKDTAVKNARLDEGKSIKILPDGDGLEFVITPTSKRWKYRYYKPITKSRTTMTLGHYPQVSLAMARAKRDEYKALLSQNIDPVEHKAEQGRLLLSQYSTTFSSVAQEWLAWRKEKANFSESYAKGIWSMISRHIFPIFGDMPINKITALIAIKGFEKIQASGKLETLKRCIQKTNEIMTYALHREMIPYNPLVKISNEFDAPVPNNYPAILPEELPEILTLLNDSDRVTRQTKLLIKWQLLTMARPVEAASARWQDIDFKSHLWIIPAEMMKRKREHKVTLNSQAMALLEDIRACSISDYYLFPSYKNPRKHVNEETANKAIVERLEYKGRQCAHGMRSIASTYLHDIGCDHETIEIALSHINKDRVALAYNRSDYLERRFKVLQAWGDFVERSATGSKLITGKHGLRILKTDSDHLERKIIK